MLTAPARVAWVQAMMVPLLAIPGYFVAGSAVALAVGYGVATALMSSLLMVWRERTTLRHPEWDGRKLFGVFILSGLERWIAVILMLGIGLGVWKLSSLPLLLGLAAAQIAWLFAVFAVRNTKRIN
ncbi:MAG: ATP synthase subunit I [Thiobacillus sp.]